MEKKKDKRISFSPCLIKEFIFKKLRKEKLQFFLSFLFFVGLFFLAVENGIFFQNVSEDLIIKDVVVKQTSAIVAGQSVKWTVLVKRDQIKQAQYLVQLPKAAKNINVKTVTNQQAQDTLSKLSSLPFLALDEKKKLIQSSSFFAKISNLIKYSFAGVEQAVEEVIETSDNQFVDLSDQIIEEPTKEEEKQEKKEEKQEEKEEKQEEKEAEDETSLEEPSSQETPADEPVIEPPAEETLIEEAPIEEITEIEPIEAVSPSDQPAIEITEPAQGETPAVEDEYVQIEYETPAPEITEQETDTGKLVTISSSEPESEQAPLVDVLAFTTIPEIFKVGDENKIQIKWQNNNNQDVAFAAYDLDNNGKLDYVEWTVPHLSEQIFEIIFISKSFKLDQDRNIIEDIYDTVRYQDNSWATIENNQYVRVTFEKKLTNRDDITIYAKSDYGGSIEVYSEGSDIIIAELYGIEEGKEYKILLSNLGRNESYDVFDLRVLNAEVELDSVYGTVWKEVCDGSGICVYQSEKGGAVAEIGNKDRESSDYEPYLKLSKWDDEVSFKIKAPDSEEKVWNDPEIKSDKDSINIDSGTTEVKWYYKDAEEQNSEEGVGTGQTDFSLLRHIDLGPIDPADMAATYEVFQKEEPSTPTIISYLPLEDVFVFYGSGELDRDLYDKKISLPITRYKTSTLHECPVIFANASGLLAFVLYYPAISQESEHFINLLVESINESLKKYDIDIKRMGDLLYYKDETQYKQIGRIAGDGNSTIFYLYLDSPLSNDKFFKATRPYITLRDGKVVPLGGLRELNENIGPSLSDEIVGMISEKLNATIFEDQFTQEENKIMDDLRPILSSDDWTKNQERDDIEESVKENSDKFEMEFVLKDKPSTNVFNFGIEAQGLKFYYQPELTEKEKDAGYFRPENVIGSYAVYYENQDKLYKTEEEAEKYGIGKAFHIYRPLVYDAVGNKVWGEMNINEGKGVLSISVSQYFLDKAVYPVVVDPTFGYTTYVSGDSTAGGTNGSVFAGAAGTGTSISAYLKTTASVDFRLALYVHSSLALVEGTGYQTFSDATFTLKTIDLSTAPVLSAIDYVIMCNPNSGKASIAYDAGDENQGHVASITESWPDPLDPTHNNNKYSIYVTYTASDVVNPTVSTLSPLDNATGVGINDNLVITFSEAVDVETGNISIKKTSDDSEFETIAVGNAKVTGTGTDTITINPAGTFALNTEYYVLIDATAFDDPAGNSYAGISSTTDWSFTTTADSTPPTVTDVTSSLANGSYKADQAVPITVTFSENVIVTGTPQLTLSTGTPSTTAIDYATGSDTSILTFTYTVAAGNTSADLDYSGTDSLALNGGTIKDAAGNNATLTLASPGEAGSLGANKALVIDTTAPTVSNVTSLTADGSYSAGGTPNVMVAFTEEVFVTGTPQLTLSTGTPSTTAVNFVSTWPPTYCKFDYTIVAGNTSADLDYSGTDALALNGGTIKDAAGNNATLTLPSPGAAGSLGANKALVIDTAVPVPTVNTVGGDSSSPWSTSDTTPSITLTLNENGDCYASETDETYDAMSDNVNCTGDAGTSITCQMGELAESASKTVYVACKDTANSGNKDTAATNEHITMEIDITPPTESVTSVAGDASVPYTGNDATPTLIFTTNEIGDCFASTDGDEKYEHMSDDTDCTDGTSTNHTCTLPDLGVDGEKIIYIACRDNTTASPNEDTAETNTRITYTLDDTVPVPTVNTVGGDSSSPWSTSDTTPSITLTLNENGDCYASETDETYDAMSDNVNCTGDAGTSITCQMGSLAESGSKTVYIACEDTLLNKDTAATNEHVTMEIDATPPVETVTSVAGDTSVPYIGLDATPTLIFTTNETGDCFASIDGDETYAEMSDDTDCTVGTSTNHTCDLPDLGVDGAKTIYIACQDDTTASANQDTAGTNTAITYTLDDTAPVLSSCPSTVQDGEENTYNTVLIGGQCWMRENINVGTLTAGANEQGTTCPTAGEIEKYCYSDNEANCTTYGGLYQWNQAMCGSTTAGAQGICPSGWHIPTHDEFTTLELAVCTSGTCATDFPYDIVTQSWRGTNEGTTLKTVDSSHFSGLIAGYRATNGLFSWMDTYAMFWSSVQSSSNAWERYLGSSYTTVWRYPDDKANGFSIRCLKDVANGVTSSLANGSYTTGQVVPIQINFSENVTVTGTPQLTLSTGTPSTTAIDYATGSDTSILTFTYTVAAGNTSADLDYSGTDSLALNGGTIKDATGNNATLTLVEPGAAGSLGGNKNIVIDTTIPSVSNINSVGGDTVVPWSTSDITPQIVLALDGNGDCYASETDETYDGMSDNVNCTGDAGTSITCQMGTLAESASKTIYVACKDTAGNEDTADTNEHITMEIDATPPVETVTSIAGDTSVPYTGLDATPTLVFTTNETGDCFASADGDETYAEMSDDTDCTVGISTDHTCDLSDLGADGAKTIYIACEDNTDASPTQDTAGTNTEITYTLDDTVPTVFTCGTGTIRDGDGETYATVSIGTQCWMATNLDYDGNSSTNGCKDVAWVNSTDVGWCGYYTGGPFTDEGLLYQWSAATAANLCPTGWHLPSDTEFMTLEESLGMCSGEGTGCSGATGNRGTTEGDEMKKSGLSPDICYGATPPCGTSGFNSLLVGYRDYNIGAFGNRSFYDQFWSSTQYSSTNAWTRRLFSNLTTVYRNGYIKAYGFSVRCLKDSATPGVTSSLANGSYTTGQEVPITITFSENVTVTGTPQLTLSTGTPSTTAIDYATGSDTSILTFTYTVAAGNISADLDYSGTDALALNGGTIKDAAGNNATLTLASPGEAGSLGANKALVIDTTASTVTDVTSSLTNGSYTTGQEVPITITFSENVTVTGTPQLTLSTGTPSTTAIDYATGSDTSILTFTYTVTAGNTSADLDYATTGALALNSGTIRDAAGNNATLTLASPGEAGSLGANKAIVIDTTAPTITGVTSSLADGSYTTGQVVPITVTFSEDVFGLTVIGDPYELTLSTGTPSTTAVDTSGSTTNTVSFNYTVAAGNTSSDLDYASTGAIDLNGGSIKDSAGNDAVLTLPSPGAAGSLGANKAIVIDTTAPTVSGVTSSLDNGSYTTGQVVPIQVSFSEDVIALALFSENPITHVITFINGPQLTLSTGTPSTTAVNYTSGSGTSTLAFNYTVAAGNNSADLDYASTGALATTGSPIEDAAGNDAVLTLASPGAAGSLGANKAIVIDTTAPNNATSLTWVETSPHNSTSVNALWTKSSSSDLANQKIQFYSDATCTVTSGSLIDLSSSTLQTRAFVGVDAITYSYKITSIDNAANETISDCSPSVMIIDTTLPIQSAWNPATGSMITTATQAITLILNEIGDCKSSTTDQAYSSMSTDCTGDGTTSISCTTSNLGSDGAKDVYIACRDTAENEDTVLTNVKLSYTLDTTPPTTSDYSPSDGSTIVDTTPEITFNTNEQGDCYISQTNYSYADMVTNTQVDCQEIGLTHTCNMTDLGADGLKTIYIACEDYPGYNKDTTGTTDDISYTLDTSPSTVVFSNDVAVGPVVLDTITGYWGDATIKKWDYDADGVCSTTSGDYTKVDTDSMDQATEANNGKYICLYGEDGIGNKTTKASANVINIDVTPSTVSGVTSSLANGNYTTSQIVPIQITLTEAVTVVGTPQLTLSTGTPSTTAVNYSSGSGTSTLTFNYTVVAGNTSSDLDYATTGALGLNSGTIKDSAGNNATLTLASPGAAGSLGANKAIVIDTTAPASVSLSISADSPTQLTATATAVDSGVGLHATTPYSFKGTGVSIYAWQSATYTSTGLTPNTSYTFQVKARDILVNESAYSDASSKYTLASVPSTLALTVDSTVQITATWLANSNPSGTEYYIENTTGSTNSGWITALFWASSGLTCNTTYSFKVKARNADSTETSYTSAVTATTSACSDTGGGGGGGGGLPPEAYLLPFPPLSVLINNDDSSTDSREVFLLLKAGSNTARVAISNNPDFTNAVQETYTEIKQWTLLDGDGNKTVYVKFFTSWGQSSESVSDTIYLGKKTIVQQVEETPVKINEGITKIIDIVKKIARIPQTVVNLIKPRKTVEPIFPPIAEVVKEEAPLAMRSRWEIMPVGPLEKFILGPMPKDLNILAQKLPQLGRTLKNIGISRATDINKLVGINLILPGLTEITSLFSIDLEAGGFLPEGTLLTELTQKAKMKIPSEIVFTRTGGGLIDQNMSLYIDQKGEPRERIEVISNKPLQFIVKPDNPARAIRGYLLFKQKNPAFSIKNALGLATASLIQVNIKEQPISAEEQLVVQEFDYFDIDKDGIWTADIVSPAVDGEYELLTVTDYLDQRLKPTQMRLTVVVDPEGYIYYQRPEGEIRVSNAEATLYWLNPETKLYEIWSAKKYQQTNPQITDVTGRYSFLVPEGNYYLKVEARGYATYYGKEFEVKNGVGVHENIELKSNNWLARYFDWKIMIILLMFVFLVYNFYRDRIRDRKIALAKNN